MKEFIVGDVKVTQTSDIGLKLHYIGVGTNRSFERSVLEETASELLEKEEFKNYAVFYDTCCMFNTVKNEE